MKKIFSAIALVAVMLNGFIATRGDRMSSDKLNIGDVELMAEGESDISPLGVAFWGSIFQAAEALGIYYVTNGGKYWAIEKVFDRHGYVIEETLRCLRCTVFGNEGCVYKGVEYNVGSVLKQKKLY